MATANSTLRKNTRKTRRATRSSGPTIAKQRSSARKAVNSQQKRENVKRVTPKTRAERTLGGWTSETIDHKLDYNEVKDFVHDLWDRTSVDEKVTWQPDKTSLRGGNVAYTIVNRKDNETGNRDAFIGITLIKQKKTGDEYTISHKTMTEYESPSFVGAPISYIKRLGGVNGAHTDKSREWRENVLNYADKEKELQEIKESGEKIKVRYGKKTYNVAFNNDYRRWMVEGQKNTYIPSKFIKPETVNL